MADRGGGPPIMACSSTNVGLARHPSDDEQSLSDSECSVTSHYLDWNLELPELSHKYDNPGNPQHQEGIISVQIQECPEGKKLYDAQYLSLIHI